jgi:large subunit ribosomal protein L6
MSRIGKKFITLPASVTVTTADDQVMVKGPKGELKIATLPNIQVEVSEGKVSVLRSQNDKQTRAYHGLMRSLIANHIKGLTDGFKKTLKLVGTGYRATAKGQGVSLALGFSHLVEFLPTAGVTLKVEGTDTIYVEGSDRNSVGQVAANLRKLRPPEPYKGKGIRYENEVIRLKPGKTAT